MAGEPPMRLLILVVSTTMLAGSTADVRSLRIHGVTGYLSEYDLTASVSSDASEGLEELSGPLTIKHVGLCTHDGPNEMLSELNLEFVDASAPVTATFNFDGHECSYRGYLSETHVGVLTCKARIARFLRPVAVRGVLWPGLDRDRAADGASCRPVLRPRARGRRLRLDLRLRHDRRRRRGLRRRLFAHHVANLSPGVLRRWRGLPRRGDGGLADRPAPRAEPRAREGGGVRSPICFVRSPICLVSSHQEDSLSI